MLAISRLPKYVAPFQFVIMAGILPSFPVLVGALPTSTLAALAGSHVGVPPATCNPQTGGNPVCDECASDKHTRKTDEETFLPASTGAIVLLPKGPAEDVLWTSASQFLLMPSISSTTQTRVDPMSLGVLRTSSNFARYVTASPLSNDHTLMTYAPVQSSSPQLGDLLSSSRSTIAWSTVQVSDGPTVVKTAPNPKVTANTSLPYSTFSRSSIFEPAPSILSASSAMQISLASMSPTSSLMPPPLMTHSVIPNTFMSRDDTSISRSTNIPSITSTPVVPASSVLTTNTAVPTTFVASTLLSSSISSVVSGSLLPSKSAPSTAATSHSTDTASETPNLSTTLIAVITIVSFLVFLALVVGTLWFMRIRRQRLAQRQRDMESPASFIPISMSPEVWHPAVVQPTGTVPGGIAPPRPRNPYEGIVPSTIPLLEDDSPDLQTMRLDSLPTRLPPRRLE